MASCYPQVKTSDGNSSRHMDNYTRKYCTVSVQVSYECSTIIRSKFRANKCANWNKSSLAVLKIVKLTTFGKTNDRIASKWRQIQVTKISSKWRNFHFSVYVAFKTCSESRYEVSDIGTSLARHPADTKCRSMSVWWRGSQSKAM